MSSPMMQRSGPEDSDLSMTYDLQEPDTVLSASNGNSSNIDLLSEDRKDLCPPMNMGYEFFLAFLWKLKTKNVSNWRRYVFANSL